MPSYHTVALGCRGSNIRLTCPQGRRSACDCRKTLNLLGEKAHAGCCPSHVPVCTKSFVMSQSLSSRLPCLQGRQQPCRVLPDAPFSTRAMWLWCSISRSVPAGGDQPLQQTATAAEGQNSQRVRPAGCCQMRPPFAAGPSVCSAACHDLCLQGGHSPCSTAAAAEGQARRGSGSAEGQARRGSATPQRVRLPQCMASRVAARSGHLLCGGQVPLGAECGVPALVPEPLPCRPLWGAVWKVLPRCGACAWLHSQLWLASRMALRMPLAVLALLKVACEGRVCSGRASDMLS